MNLIKKMNNYIKNQENKCECNRCNSTSDVNDAVDALNYLAELLPYLNKDDWKGKTSTTLDKIAESNPMFDEGALKKYFDPKEFKYDVGKCEAKCESKKNEYTDYERNINVLYAQLCLVLQEVCTTLMLGPNISQTEWEGLSRKIMQAYNYAAKDSGYYMDIIMK